MLISNTIDNTHSSNNKTYSIRIVAIVTHSKSIVTHSGLYSTSTSKHSISVAQLWLVAYSRYNKGNTYCFGIVQNSGDFF